MHTEEEAVVDTGNTITSEAPERDFEKEARANGWVPEAEFKGDRKPAQFLDAETFVKRGEEITPFVQRQNAKLKAELDKREADFAKRLERMEKSTQKAFDVAEKQHKAEIDRVKREQVAAVEAGDVKEYAKLEKIKGELEASAPKADDKSAPVTDAEKLEEARSKWREANPWFDDDFDMQDFAVKYSHFYGQKHPNLTFEENMKFVEAKVKEKFPDRFGKTAGNGHAAVDGGGNFPGAGRKQGKTGADLPAEARIAGEKFVKQGLFKDINAYAKEYYNG